MQKWIEREFLLSDTARLFKKIFLLANITGYSKIFPFVETKNKIRGNMLI